MLAGVCLDGGCVFKQLRGYCCDMHGVRGRELVRGWHESTCGVHLWRAVLQSFDNE